MSGATRAALMITGAMLVAGWFASRDPLWFVLNAVSLLFVYTLPALQIRSSTDIRRRWKRLLVLILVLTLVWDFLDARIRGVRPFLGTWYVVYPSSPAFFFGLFWLHARLAKRLAPRGVPV